MKITHVRALGALLIVAALAGCSLGQQTREQPASYDLGPPRDHVAGPAIAVTLMVSEVAAAPWLDGTGVIYRLAYQNDARPRAYAHSRWVAPPAQLLTQRLRNRFTGAVRGVTTGSEGARADYALRIELEDFSQAFSAVDASRAALRARATLVRPAQRELVAQRVFAIERPAPTPDAQGGVAALGAASDDLVEQLAQWVGQQITAARAR